jgi:hypothetical protein
MSIIGALILLFIWDKINPDGSWRSASKYNPRFEKLAASPAPKATDK